MILHADNNLQQTAGSMATGKEIENQIIFNIYLPCTFQDSCLYSLIQDYITAGGICKDTEYSTNGPPNFEPYPAAWPTSTDPVCTTTLVSQGQCYSEQYQQNFPCSEYDITSGVCSASTVTKLATTTCQNEFNEQPSFLYSTLDSIMRDMCSSTEIQSIEAGWAGRRRKRSERKTQSDLHLRRLEDRDFLESLGRQNISRLAPIGLATTASGSLISTDLKFGKYFFCRQLV